MPYGIDPYTGKPLPPGAIYPQAQPQPQSGAPQMPGMPGAPQAPQAGTQDTRALEEALLGTYGDVMEADALEKQMAQAEALRMATPEGRSSGRVYTAANPLEHLGKGIGDYKLMKKRQQYEKDSAATRGRIGENVKKYGLNLPE